MRCRWPWSAARTARNCWVATCVVVLCVALPLCIYELDQQNYEKHIMAWFIAAIFVFLAVPISVGEVVLHLNHYTNPKLQRYVIRLIWMVPIYAITSWLALRFKDAQIYLDTARDLYEAFAIYSFTFFLIACLGEEADINAALAPRPPVRHFFPFTCLPAWRTDNGQFLSRCKHGVLSYTVIKIITTILALLLEWGGKYGEGEIDSSKGYVYIATINNFSQIWAMYCLVLFYKVCKDDLAHWKPVGKLLCVKSVVFLSFWQSVAIALLVHYDVISTDSSWTVYNAESVAKGLQDFLICIEMFFAALAHLKAFSHRDYKNPELPRGPFIKNFREMFAVDDVRQDLYGHVKEVTTGMLINPIRQGVKGAAQGVAKVVRKAKVFSPKNNPVPGAAGGEAGAAGAGSAGGGGAGAGVAGDGPGAERVSSGDGDGDSEPASPSRSAEDGPLLPRGGAGSSSSSSGGGGGGAGASSVAMIELQLGERAAIGHGTSVSAGGGLVSGAGAGAGSLPLAVVGIRGGGDESEPEPEESIRDDSERTSFLGQRTLASSSSLSHQLAPQQPLSQEEFRAAHATKQKRSH